jgi:rhodanese-related sulfurtransferase
MCATGVRSAAVTGYLLRSGWADVANVEGGITAWQRAGLPVERGR